MSRKNQNGYEPDDLLITPEMIEAGVAVLRAYSPDMDSISETVREILIKALARSGRVQAEQGEMVCYSVEANSGSLIIQVNETPNTPPEPWIFQTLHRLRGELHDIDEGDFSYDS